MPLANEVEASENGALGSLHRLLTPGPRMVQLDMAKCRHNGWGDVWSAPSSVRLEMGDGRGSGLRQRGAHAAIHSLHDEGS